MVVKLYCTKWCTQCNLVKSFFKENKVKFKEMNVQEDSKAADDMKKKTGQTGVPVTDINGKIVIGFDMEKMRKYLKLK
jgi:glutaredoxin 3